MLTASAAAITAGPVGFSVPKEEEVALALAAAVVVLEVHQG